jgi:hypothetical protein
MQRIAAARVTVIVCALVALLVAPDPRKPLTRRPSQEPY